MSQMTVVWTALPNGLTGDVANRRVLLSAYVSMRLTTDDGTEGTLAAFPAALNWPSLLQTGAFSLAVSGNGGAETPATLVSAAPDPQLWQDLFIATTRVVSHTPDNLTGRPFNTYQASAVHDQLRAGHQRLSQTSPVALPTRRQLLDALPDLHGAFGPALGPVLPAVRVDELDSHPDLARVQSLVARDLLRPSSGNSVHHNMALLAASARRLAASAALGTPILLVPDDGTPEAKFKQLYAFHHREPVDPNNPPPPPVPPNPDLVLDFHQALSALAQYPELLRKLGLVFDLEVPEASLPQSPLSAGSGRVQIMPAFTSGPAFTNLSPMTAYILDGDRLFTPASQNPAQPETIAGLVNLALPEGYTLIQADVDSMGLKTLNMAASNTLSTSNGDGGDSGTPAPGGMGISLARTNHAAVLAQRFATAAQNNQNASGLQAVTLFAEDLTRGFRFDVFNESSGWRSLHARTGSYVFLNHPGGPLTLSLSDEGLAQPTATNRVDGSEDVQAQIFVHDSLLHWKGWSLGAPRPGKTIANDGPATITNRTPDTGFPLEVNFVCQPGTLPRLRFHRRYQIRARAVDLAGNSISVAEADDVLNNLLPVLNRPLPVLPPNVNDFTFRRFEPVSAPHVVPRERFTEGESAARMLIRSNVGESAAACASRLMALVAASRPADRVIYTAVNDRHLVPPKTSQLTAEMHELFDSSFGATAGFLTTYNLARKEKGRLTDTAIVDTATGNPVSIPDTTGIDPVSGNQITRPAVEFVATGGKNGYAVHHEPQLQLPYLPDLLSRGATLCGLPGVAPGHAGVLDPAGDLTFVNSTLPPQNIGSLVSTTQIGFGTNWPGYLPFRLQLAEPSNPDGPSELPSWDSNNRVLTLHLAKAETQTVRLSSFLNPNDLDILGVWQWILERKAAQGLPPPDAGDAQTAIEGCMWMLTPFLDIELVHAVQQPLKAPALQSLITPRDFQATFAYIGATVPVHGKSTARLELAASWQENLDNPLQPGPTVRSVKAHVFDFDIHLPSEPVSEQPGIAVIGTYDANGDTVTFDAPVGDPQGRTFLARHEFGDTKHRTVNYQLTATTRFREYFPAEITDKATNLTQVGPAVTIEVPSSARPSAPNVLYAVPMFEWSRTTNDDGSQVRIRKGGGIRIYLGRPWFSSGDGEMLAAVLSSPGDYPPDDAHRNLVTHWGNDPAYLTDPLALPPQVTDFPLAAETPGSLSLAERADRAVAAAAHSVEFNTDRQLWFCDMRVNPGTVYSPFIRLALARYQKNSVSDTELSRVVLTDFVQLLPDRTVKVNPVAGDPNSFTIRVEGISYRANAWNTAPLESLSPDGIIIRPRPPLSPPSLIFMSLEQRISRTTDEAGWQTFGDGSNVAATSAVDAENPEGTLLWSGKVSLPPERTPGQFRVVICEQEHLFTDERIKKEVTIHFPPDPDIPHDHGHTETDLLTFAPGGPRLVFAETIEL